MSNERSAQIFSEPLQLSRALPRCARRPALQPQEDDENRRCNDQRHKRQRDWPRTRCGFADFDIGRSALSVSVQTQSSKSKITSKKKAANVFPKKLPPPTPDRREGRLFPPEQS
jgi:hypothetical protein